MFKRPKKWDEGSYEFLIAGLGNPGREYEVTRHNIGFLTLDRMADRYSVKIGKLKHQCLYCDISLGGRRGLLIKPQTFMNRSGEAIRDFASFYKIQPSDIVIIVDDTALEVGRLRIRRQGTDGGHNGLKDIIYQLRSDGFPRIRIGVGEKPHPDYDMADWVLSRFKPEEEKVLLHVMDDAISACQLIVDGQMDKAMNLYNTKHPLPKKGEEDDKTK